LGWFGNVLGGCIAALLRFYNGCRFEKEVLIGEAGSAQGINSPNRSQLQFGSTSEM
jgi:hypothetical protein